MKKIFSIMAVAAAAAMMISCEIVKQEIKPLDNNELTDYAGKLFSNSVLLPVELAEVAIAIDEYLALSEEQRLEDGSFTVRTISDGVCQVYKNNMSCTVETDGHSVWEDGAEWKYLSFVSTITPSNSYESGGWRTSLTDDVYLTFNSDQLEDAKLMVQVDMPGGDAIMTLKSREDGKSVWNLTVEGTDVGSDGLCVEYRAGYDTGGITVAREVIGPATRKTYQGLFFVDIYKNDSKIAWIEMVLNSGSSTQCVINRMPVSQD